MVTAERTNEPVYIACGAGCADDRADPAVELVGALRSTDGPRYLIYETLAERTLALAQRERRADDNLGYTPRLEHFLRPVLQECVTSGIKIIGNFGAANPLAAARCIRRLAMEFNIPDLKIAVIHGDDLLQSIPLEEIRSSQIIDGDTLGSRDIIAANAYLGARPIAEAISRGADVVVSGRCTDSALTLGPLMHEFGWGEDAWDLLAAGTLAGHLLECSAQVTGGYFADPGYKDVPNLANVGFPIAEVEADGSIVITKPHNTGGLVSSLTVKEQMLYEIFDPANYLTPDVIMDMSEVDVLEIAPDRIRLTGVRGRERPPTLKATVSVDGGWLAEGEISYAGPNAYRRGELAAAVLAERLQMLALKVPTRIDLVGTISTFDSNSGSLRSRQSFAPDGDYRVRLACMAPDRSTAESVAQEVIGLYSTGPAGGGGIRTSVSSRVHTASILIDRERVQPHVVFAP